MSIVIYMSIGVRVTGSLELELQIVVKCQFTAWVLRIEQGSSGRAVSGPNL